MATAIHPFSPEEIMAYQDGELSPQRALQASQHLQQCRECQNLIEDLQGLSKILGTWTVEPPTSAPPVPAQEMHTEKPVPFWRRKWLIALPVGVVLMVVAIANRPHRSLVKDSSSVVMSESLVSQASSGLVERKSSPPVLKQYAALQENMSEEGAALHAQPKIVRTAQLSLVSKDFSRMRSEVERIVASQAGYVSQLQLNMQTGTSRSLTASLKIPSSHLEAAIGELKQLGYAASESQSGEDVTERSVDLNARLSNLKATEVRLQQILANRTGKLSEVLEVEQAVDRIRGQIETAEAEQKVLSNQISYAAVQIFISEEYRLPLESDSGSALIRLRNAAVDGYRNAVNLVMSGATFLLSVAPAALLVIVICFFPALWFWRRRRRTHIGNVL